MKIFIGNDHTAIEMKNKIVEYLENKKYEVINIGTDSSSAVDYPDFGYNTAKLAVENNTLGIVICGSGIGISIAANKVKNARAALCYDEKAAEMARKHNDANILALGARVIAVQKALDIIDVFISTSFEGERHQNRVNKLNNL
ncbi:ribose 5-phosphate isomerase B [Spiroplasma turonicum]|uniref:Ribose-5-phosphate isomerase B n=1 Tax=Spiroplasma turonicum TaxID=216946 RepID=A0A0K1P4S9_9MOLU|nr:ribose 5-phosphate isomerase B [Spiroplasma turonicum]AKU79288.1 ribose-5-phosphate isomerase B [Spiroplasma turonicum]ALX70311.1 ribose-5-phosphate isomerase B [Spiroplasma turonicum]